MKKSGKNVLGMLVMVLTFGLIVSGPVWSQDKGSLTITDIPAEYEGKFASFSYEMSSKSNKVSIIASGQDASKIMGKIEGAAITDGSVQLLLFKKIPVVGTLAAYTGSDTVRVILSIRDTAESDQDEGKGIQRVDPEFIFPSVKFEKGVASVKISDAFKVGFLTITGIPKVYNSNINLASIRFTRPDEKKKNTNWLHDTKGEIKDGMLTVKYYRGSEEGNYTPYTGMLDITVAMGSPQSTVKSDMAAIGLQEAAVPIKLLFKAQMTNDNATLDFAQGVKQ